MASRSPQDSRDLTAVILAAGYATRLYPLTLNIPKPLLRVRPGQSVIDFIVDQLEPIRGLREIVVVTNDKFAGDFRRWARGRRTRRPITVLNDGTHSNEDRLGAIGDLYFAVRKKKIEGDLFVAGGDNLFDRGFARFVDFARGRRPYAALGLFDIRDRKEATRFGVVCAGAQGRVRGFEEKPARPKSTLVATCLYYFPKETHRLLKRYIDDPHTVKDAPGNLIRWLMEHDRVFGCTLRQGHWYDIGHFDSYREVIARFNRIKAQ